MLLSFGILNWVSCWIRMGSEVFMALWEINYGFTTWNRGCLQKEIEILFLYKFTAKEGVSP